MYLFINSVRRTINFYYVSIDFFFLQIRFDVRVFANKNYSDYFIFHSLSLSFNSWEQIGDTKLFARGVPLDGTPPSNRAFLLVSQWNRVEKCDEFQDSNHQATISKDYRYQGGREGGNTYL